MLASHRGQSLLEQEQEADQQVTDVDDRPPRGQGAHPLMRERLVAPQASARRTGGAWLGEPEEAAAGRLIAHTVSRHQLGPEAPGSVVEDFGEAVA